MQKLAWPIVLLLLALVIQLGLLVHGLRGIAEQSYLGATSVVVDERDPQTAGRIPLPAGRAPGQPAWPPATVVEIGRYSMFADEYRTWHTNAEHSTTHSLVVTRMGLPMRMLLHVRRWWPWDDPAWASTTGNKAADELVILWHAFAINTFATAALLALPIVVARLARAARAAKRRRAGHCTSCGYDLAGLAMCPECGLAASRGNPAHSAATPSPVP